MYQFAERHDRSISLFHAHAPAKREAGFGALACHPRIDQSRAIARGIPSIDLREDSNASPEWFFVVIFIVTHTHSKDDSSICNSRKRQSG
jgi:hypothetical protein